MTPTAAERLRRVRAVVTDVDGCLTDGRIAYGDAFLEIKEFDIKDGMGVTLANRAGLVTAVITGRTSHAVARRTSELGFSSVFQGFEGKPAAWDELLVRHGLRDDEIAYLGDDLLDLPCLLRAGCSFSPADAVEEVRSRVGVVLHARGGCGAFREMVETILKAQGRWDDIVRSYAEGRQGG